MECVFAEQAFLWSYFKGVFYVMFSELSPDVKNDLEDIGKKWKKFCDLLKIFIANMILWDVDKKL